MIVTAGVRSFEDVHGDINKLVEHKRNKAAFEALLAKLRSKGKNKISKPDSGKLM